MATTSIDSGTVTLAVFERSRIWRVALDGRFYGDYVKQEWAEQAAVEKAHQLIASGVRATVQITDARTKIANVLDQNQCQIGK